MREAIFADRLVRVPRHAVAQAAEASAGRGDLGFEQLAHARADGEVAAADDALGDAAGAVAARRAHRRDAVDELDLAQRRHLAWAALRYIARHSRNTVETMLCPPPISASSSGSR